jgi:hypothetical protein
MSDNDAPIDDSSALEVVGLSPEALGPLELSELRTARDRAVDQETGLSYLRRMVQAPLDMVRGELERRASGQPSDLASLVDDLPRILSEHTGPGGGRLPHAVAPTEVDPQLSAELDELTEGGMRIAMLPSSSDDELVALAGSLDGLERRVSRRRRLLHRTIDLLNAELARRYGSGEATVESALADASPEAGD